MISYNALCDIGGILVQKDSSEKEGIKKISRINKGHRNPPQRNTRKTL